jgi:hypothetical protein
MLVTHNESRKEDDNGTEKKKKRKKVKGKSKPSEI